MSAVHTDKTILIFCEYINDSKQYNSTIICDILNQPPKMSGLSYFSIQIQSWIFKIPSKSNHSQTFLKLKVHVQIKSNKITKIQLFNNKYHAIRFD